MRSARSTAVTTAVRPLQTARSGIGISAAKDVPLPEESRAGDRVRSAVGRTLGGVEIVLETATPEGIRVVLPALVYAKVLEEHAAVADLELIDRTIRSPDERRPDPRPGRERFLRRERDVQVLAVVEFGDVPAIIVTVFSAMPERS